MYALLHTTKGGTVRYLSKKGVASERKMPGTFLRLVALFSTVHTMAPKRFLPSCFIAGVRRIRNSKRGKGKKTGRKSESSFFPEENLVGRRRG